MMPCKKFIAKLLTCFLTIFCVAPAFADSENIYVGALGVIEPRSRVLNISHDFGPSGVLIEHLYVSEGDNVKVGQPLVKFSNHDNKKAYYNLVSYQIESLLSDLRSQQADFDLAKKEFLRYERLAKTSSVSLSLKDSAELKFKQSESKLEKLNAELNILKSQLEIAQDEFARSIKLAPIDGVILKIHSWPGERASDNSVIEIANLEEFDVVAEVYERDISRVSIGKKAKVNISGIVDDLEGEVYKMGFLVYKNDLNKTDPLSNRDNRIVEVRIKLPKEISKKIKHMIYRQVQVRIL